MGVEDCALRMNGCGAKFEEDKEEEMGVVGVVMGGEGGRGGGGDKAISGEFNFPLFPPLALFLLPRIVTLTIWFREPEEEGEEEEANGGVE